MHPEILTYHFNGGNRFNLSCFNFFNFLFIYFYGEEGKRPAVFDCLLIKIAEKLFDS